MQVADRWHLMENASRAFLEAVRGSGNITPEPSHILYAHKVWGYDPKTKGSQMPRPATAGASSRRPTNVTLPDALLRDARDLGINLSQACERGLVAEVVAVRRQRWLAENHDAIQDWNTHVSQHGLPLAAYRQF